MSLAHVLALAAMHGPLPAELKFRENSVWGTDLVRTVVTSPCPRVLIFQD